MTARPSVPGAPLPGLGKRVHGDAWSRLFARYGADGPDIPPARSHTSFVVYRQALLQGRGVGPAWRGLMDDDLDTGRLEPVTDLTLATDEHGYWVTTPDCAPGAPEFRAWLLATAGRSGT